MIRVIGDTHGSLKREDKRKFLGLTQDDIVIITGDFGFIWGPSLSSARMEIDLNFRLYAQFRGTILFVDGNHENFEVLKSLPDENLYGGIVGKVDDRVYHLRRGQVYTLEGKKFFTFGGGNSYDKQNRVPFISWWEDELPTNREYNTGLDNLTLSKNKVDYILTHTCSIELVEEMNNRGFISLKDGSEERAIRQYFSMISSKVSYKQWLFGHFHVDFESSNYKARCLWNNFFDIGLV